MSSEPKTLLLEVAGVSKFFRNTKGWFQGPVKDVKAVEDVTFTIKTGETFGLVGESGCGKTTLGRCIVRLIQPTSGRITFSGIDLQSLSARAMRPIRRHLQIIFQDPYASLNPRMTAGAIIGEALKIHNLAKGREVREQVHDLLHLVGLDRSYEARYPHEFSGGQRQRIGIARALALKPRFIVADEPVSALDVSIQAQIINLMQELQEKFELTYLFISHNLNIVEHVSETVAVMYRGRIVEMAPKRELYKSPLHPYTQALLSAIPASSENPQRARSVVVGDAPGGAEVRDGCLFEPRCDRAERCCKTDAPVLLDVGNSHSVSCHLVKQRR